MRRSIWLLILPLVLAAHPLRALAQDDDDDGGDEGSADEGGGDEGGDEGDEDGDDDDGDGDDGGEEDDTTPPPATNVSALGAEVDADQGERTGIYPKLAWPLELIKRPLTAAKGMIEVNADLEMELSKGVAFKPVGLAPDVFFGATDKLSVGVQHGIGICFVGEKNGCAEVYNEFALAAKFAFKQGPFNAAAYGAFQLGGLAAGGDILFSANVGAIAHLRAGKVGATGAFIVNIPVDPRADAGNESFVLPVEGQIQASPQFAIRIILGFNGPFEGLSKAFKVPFGFGVLFALNRKVDIKGEFVWTNALGKGRTGDARHGVIGANLRF